MEYCNRPDTIIFFLPSQHPWVHTHTAATKIKNSVIICFHLKKVVSYPYLENSKSLLNYK